MGHVCPICAFSLSKCVPLAIYSKAVPLVIHGIGYVYVSLVVFVSWIGNVNISLVVYVSLVYNIIIFNKLTSGFTCVPLSTEIDDKWNAYIAVKISIKIKKNHSNLLRASNNTTSPLKHVKICLDLAGKIPRRKG